MALAIDISGRRFGKLVAKRDIGNKHSSRLWLCVCDCGNSIEVISSSLISWNTKSCGCLRIEVANAAFTKHGAKLLKKPTPEYAVWSLMRDRCNNPRNQSYGYYGGRGIVVAESWNDFSTFLSDMGPRPTGTTIDRIDPNGNYEPGNCRWATRKEQSRNRSYCIRVEWKGEDRLLCELADEYKLTPHILHQRLHMKWTLDRALTQPLRIKNNA